MNINVNEYQFFVISDDGPHRESCNIFYAHYAFAKDEQAAVRAWDKDADYDPATKTIIYVGTEHDRNYFVNRDYFIQSMDIDVIV